MTRTWMNQICVALFVAMFLPSLPAAAAQGEPAPGAHRYFTDVKLINQDGETVSLYSDLLEGKVVVIDTMFTTCKSVCPVMHRTFRELQTWLGDRLGEEVHLISITVDPETDTPEKLRQYAEDLEARPGWHFITGEKENLEFALRKLGQFVEDKDDHSTVFLIGNEPTGLWKKAMGMSHPREIAKIVDSVLKDGVLKDGVLKDGVREEGALEDRGTAQGER